MTERLSLDQTKAALLAAADAIIAATDRLTKADQAIGDGDHGLGMARGFKAAKEALDKKPAAHHGDLFKTVGMAIVSTSGGASGAVFGTFFTGAAKVLTVETLDASTYAVALAEGQKAVQARGKAEPGHKTMLDALAPAAEAARANEGAGLLAAARAAAAAAEEGVERTKDMVAQFGRARTLGERALGHPDPGAISITIILTAIATSIEGFKEA
ncbi:MAG TPA: dihydroxyacetone kinase subunit DhaL [Geminicoccus sp.]|jgi:dihydroxyacetone kinase-like protein|uniref:dihydroxyacetone kinase subunit DhaL n=1 Tax=Geminicoccus sp. TaxID=2024832 RepID=UPI002E3706D2|nr:dihydroxyacetone kinase subunit DhaL [Geminicoccus sp.]HEX2527358.1 dihydroxyacetone kinase subunit DhaL [Geminicoccus sp.]